MKKDKRRTILRAAELIFRGRRFHEVHLDDVAAAARVGKGTIYLYFSDKEDLFLKVMTDGFLDLEDRLAKVAASDKPVGAKLCAFGETLTAVLKERHMIIPAIMSPEFARKRPDARSVLKSHHDRLDSILAGILEEGVRAGGIRADADINMFICAFIGGLHGLARRRKRDSRRLPVRELVALLLEGAQPGRVADDGKRKKQHLQDRP